MTDPPTILQVVHGHPPREVAGTELYTARLTAALRARGWTVHVVAATRDTGRPHGSLHPPEVPGEPWRVVNNLPWRPLSHGERDALIEDRLAQVFATVAPDMVHVQHLLFLSCALPWSGPTVATLHDAWAWCARGGTLLRDGEAPCPGPEPEACAACYAGWARGSAAEHALGRVAGELGRLVPAERLQAAWQRLPGGVRGLVQRGPPPRVGAADVSVRQDAVRSAFAAFERRLSPSRWLADQAVAQGLGAVHHVPHGVAAGAPRVGGGPCVFLGSLVPHKGPDLVVAGWRSLGVRRRVPPLVLYGPPVDPACAAALPQDLLAGPVAPDEVPALLAEATVLILGSRWPENSPLVVLEARASGCPVVAPRLGGLPELIEEGRDGALYDPGDPVDLARALARVLDLAPTPRPPPDFAGHVDAVEAHYRAVLS